MEVQESSWKTLTVFVLSRSEMDQKSEGHGKERDFYSFGHEASEHHHWERAAGGGWGETGMSGAVIGQKGIKFLWDVVFQTPLGMLVVPWRGLPFHASRHKDMAFRSDSLK